MGDFSTVLWWMVAMIVFFTACIPLLVKLIMISNHNDEIWRYGKKRKSYQPYAVLLPACLCAAIGCAIVFGVNDSERIQANEISEATRLLQAASDAQQRVWDEKGHYTDSLDELRFASPTLNVQPDTDQLELVTMTGKDKYYINYQYASDQLFSIAAANGLIIGRACNASEPICQDGQWTNPDQEQR